jgi:4-nitrophenyl phosphatase
VKLRAFVFDLDGTVYRGSDPIPGAADFLTRLQDRGVPYLFVTNRGNRTPDQIADQLISMGIPCSEEMILTSSQVAARHLGAVRIFVVGETGVYTALEQVGAKVVEEHPDVVLVTYHRGFNYAELTQATRHILAGARLVATNRDSLIMVEDGVLPEAGPLVSALETATNTTAEVIGKPNRMIMDQAVTRLQVPHEECAVIGDFLLTDILAAHNANMPSALILTGISSKADILQAPCEPTWIAEDYDDLKRQLFPLL